MRPKQYAAFLLDRRIGNQGYVRAAEQRLAPTFIGRFESGLSALLFVRSLSSTLACESLNVPAAAVPLRPIPLRAQ
jgi:hypothetical protein